MTTKRRKAYCWGWLNAIVVKWPFVAAAVTVDCILSRKSFTHENWLNTCGVPELIIIQMICLLYLRWIRSHVEHMMDSFRRIMNIEMRLCVFDDVRRVTGWLAWINDLVANGEHDRANAKGLRYDSLCAQLFTCYVCGCMNLFPISKCLLHISHRPSVFSSAQNGRNSLQYMNL